MTATATFSEDRAHRYALTRSWDDTKSLVQFIGLNPSTADESVDDPTIRRCMGYAKDWGYGGLIMTNLCSYRATDPTEMHDYIKYTKDLYAIENYTTIREVARISGLVVAAWGANDKRLFRGEYVRRLVNEIRPLHVLRLTKDGFPSHPLYLPKDLKPFIWEPKQ